MHKNKEKNQQCKQNHTSHVEGSFEELTQNQEKETKQNHKRGNATNR